MVADSSREDMARDGSPTLSDISELTILSRSPSPVLEYNAHRSRTYLAFGVDEDTGQKLRGLDGRSFARKSKREHSPDEGPSEDFPELPRTPRKRRSHVEPLSPTTPKTPRKRRARNDPSSPAEPSTPRPWVTGAGGFGTLCVLPKEIRQLIYSYILDVERAVTFRYCCGPETTKRERDACQKHRPVAGRFNVLFLSKLIRHEASWVLHNQGSLRIDVTRTIQHYLDGSRAKSLRHMSDSIHKNSKKALMWAAVACYRSIIILVSDRQLRMGDPALFTDHLVEIACLLGKCWEGRIVGIEYARSTTHHVRLDIGNIFHQMLPFNLKSQGGVKYGELLEWILINGDGQYPNFDRLANDAEKNLKRLARAIRMYNSQAQWKIVAEMEVRKEDEGGAKSLDIFRKSCVRNEVEFEASE